LKNREFRDAKRFHGDPCQGRGHLAYAGREGAKLNTIDRTELFSGRGSEIDGHGGRDFSEV